MKILSPAFADGDYIPQKYTCDGEGISPPLEFREVPEEAVSLVLWMEDPDVPREIRADGKWQHWLVWNLDSRLEGVDEGEEPAGVHGLTTSGTLDYVPPCPPDREHRYFFRLYALDTSLDLPEGSTIDQLLQAMDGHIIAQAEMFGRYDRRRF